MRQHTFGMKGLLVAMLIGGSSAIASAQRPCSTADTSSQKLRAIAVNIITTSTWASLRSGMGITTGDTSNVTIVTADSVCEAITASNDALTSTTSQHALRIIAFQRFFLAVNPDKPANMTEIYFFNSAYRRKGAIMQP